MSATDNNRILDASAGPDLAVLPAGQCFDCTGCGTCCSGIFTILLSDEEGDRLAAQGWERDPALQGETLFVKQGKRWRLAHRAGGACVFLDDDSRCRIHARFGAEAKPLACRLFPFRFVPAGAGARVDLRFDCPAVAENTGRPLVAHRDELATLLPLALSGPAAEPAPLHGAQRVGWGQLERITEAFARLIAHRELDLTARVVACVQMSAILRRLKREALDDAALEGILATIVNTLILTAEKDPLERIAPSRGALAGFRQLLVVYGREDRWGRREGLLARYRSLFSMMGGDGPVPPLREGFPAVEFAALEGPVGFPPDEVVEPLERFLRVRLESMGFFGASFAGYGYLDGLNALLLTYPVVFWFARAYASGQGLPAPDAACIRTGVSIVGHAHGLATVFNVPLERYHLRSLCDPVVLCKLAVWYGR